jgi:hypothetical protein
MRTIDIYVADRSPPDASILHQISLASLQKTFCFKVSRLNRPTTNVELDSNCINSPNVAFYTFVGDDDRALVSGTTMGVVWEQVATMYMQFLRQKCPDASGASILNHSEIRKCVVESCEGQWVGNYAQFLKTASFSEIDKKRYNITCGKLLKSVVLNAPMRFRTFQYEHTYAIPFLLGDRIHFGCTIQSYHGTQRYDIRLLVSS